MHRNDERFDSQAKLRCEHHLQPPTRFAVKDGALWNAGSKHLLQAQGLGADLHKIAVGGFALTPFVLHGKRLRAKLHDVGAAGQPKALAFEQQTASRSRCMPSRLPGLVRALMQQASLRREPILLPNLLQMDERPLPRAEGEVLQAAYRKRVGVSESINACNEVHSVSLEQVHPNLRIVLSVLPVREGRWRSSPSLPGTVPNLHRRRCDDPG